jgi:hypothetical protein
MSDLESQRPGNGEPSREDEASKKRFFSECVEHESSDEPEKKRPRVKGAVTHSQDVKKEFPCLYWLFVQRWKASKKHIGWGIRYSVCSGDSVGATLQMPKACFEFHIWLDYCCGMWKDTEYIRGHVNAIEDLLYAADDEKEELILEKLENWEDPETPFDLS